MEKIDSDLKLFQVSTLKTSYKHLFFHFALNNFGLSISEKAKE